MQQGRVYSSAGGRACLGLEMLRVERKAWSCNLSGGATLVCRAATQVMLREVVDDVLDLMRPLAGPDVELTNTVPMHIAVFADKARLVQVRCFCMAAKTGGRLYWRLPGAYLDVRATCPRANALQHAAVSVMAVVASAVTFAGAEQPAEQRRQVHAARHGARVGAAMRRRVAGRGNRLGHRHRHPARQPDGHLPAVRAGVPLECNRVLPAHNQPANTGAVACKPMPASSSSAQPGCPDVHFHHCAACAPRWCTAEAARAWV